MTTKMEKLIMDTAKSALQARYGFKPAGPAYLIEIYDVVDRTEFKIRFPYSGKQAYQFKSYAQHSDTALDGLNVWCGADTITEIGKVA